MHSEHVHVFNGRIVVLIIGINDLILRLHNAQLNNLLCNHDSQQNNIVCSSALVCVHVCMLMCPDPAEWS